MLPCENLTHPSPSLIQATTNLFFISKALLFQKCFIDRITEYVAFWDWLFPLCGMCASQFNYPLVKGSLGFFQFLAIIVTGKLEAGESPGQEEWGN